MFNKIYINFDVHRLCVTGVLPKYVRVLPKYVFRITFLLLAVYTHLLSES